MHRLLFTSLLLAGNLSLQAQQTTVYTYDANGNVTSRYVPQSISSYSLDDSQDNLDNESIELIKWAYDRMGDVLSVTIAINTDNPATISLYNDASHKLYSCQFKNSHSIDMSKYKDGLYLVEVTLKEGNSSWKFYK